MKLSDLQKQELIADYKDGMTWSSICEKYQTNTNTIHKIFKKYNVVNNRVKELSWSIDKQEKFKRMYLSNRTYQEMYNALNCKGGTLTYWVHKLNLPMRGSGRNSMHPNKFKEDTIESSYWLGYIFADGHIGVYKRPKGANSYIIELSSEKEYVVKKFKEWYNNIPFIHTFSYTLKDGTIKTMYKASIYSKDIALWFKSELNIDNTKHHTLNPNITLNWDIIRGFFDGDGSSAKGEWQIKSCSKTWLERIQKFLEEYNITSILKRSYLDCWGLFIYDKKEIKKIVPLMYQNKYYCHKYKFLNFEPLISNDEVNIG